MTQNNHRENDKNIFNNFQDLLNFSYRETPCQRSPGLCQPRPINHVIWDADETIWNIKPGYLASNCGEPFKKIDENTLEATCKSLHSSQERDGLSRGYEEKAMPAKVELLPGLLNTVRQLKKMGIGSSIASNNLPGSVEKIIDALGIRQDFTVVNSSWDNKVDIVNKVMKKLNADPDKVLFVDDTPSNVIDVFDYLDVPSLCMGIDIFKPQDVLNYVKPDKE